MISLSQILPNATRNKEASAFDQLLLIVLVEWGWDYNTFLEVPIPVLLRTLRAYKKQKDKEAAASKKKK